MDFVSSNRARASPSFSSPGVSAHTCLHSMKVRRVATSSFVPSLNFATSSGPHPRRRLRHTAAPVDAVQAQAAGRLCKQGTPGRPPHGTGFSSTGRMCKSPSKRACATAGLPAHSRACCTACASSAFSGQWEAWSRPHPGSTLLSPGPGLFPSN